MSKKNDDKEKLVSKCKEMRTAIESQVEHCDWQIKRLSEKGDKVGTADWLHKSYMAEKLLKDFDDIFGDLNEL